jgi:hypothetical protein
MNSSKQKRGRTLVDLEGKKFLEGLANLADTESGLRWFQTNFPYVLEDVREEFGSWLVRHWATNVEGADYEPNRSDAELIRQYWLLPLRDTLRAIWRAKDARTKQWGIFRISQDFFRQGAKDLIQLPLANSSDSFLAQMRPPSRTEQLLLGFTSCAARTHYCSNPDCSTPYFIAGRRTQKYCSDLCAQPAQRKWKRDWWLKHGKPRRANQSRGRSKKKAGSRSGRP